MSRTEPTSAGQHVADDIAFMAGQAMESDRPLFLIVYYEHEAVKITFLKTLAKTLHKAGINTQTFDPVQRPDHGAGRLYPLLSAITGRTLALIVGLPLGLDASEPARSFLDYLNLHRDQISRDKLRMVLFLHTSDAGRFMASAGDLWDFRHHTYWLEGAPPRDGISLWQSMEQGVGETTLVEQDKEDIARHMQRIRELIEQTGTAEEKAALFLDLSDWLRRRYAFAPAVQAALEGLELIPDTPSELRGKLEFALGYSLQMDNNLSDALVHFQRSLAICQDIGDKAGEGTTLNNISQIYRARDDYGAALEYLVKSLAISQEIGDKMGEGTTLNNISLIYNARGEYDIALEYLKKSLAIRQEIGDKSGEGTTLNNISIIYHARGNYDTALKYLEKSLAISQEIGDKSDEGTTLNNISQIYRARGEYDIALEYLKKSLAICQEIGDRSGEWATLNNISQIYHPRGDHDAALEYLKKSLAICKEIGNNAGEGTTLNNISLIYNVRGEYDIALEYLKKSLAIRQEIGDKAGEGVTCWNLAQEYKRRGELDKAITFARKTVEIEEELQHPDAQKSLEFLQWLEAEYGGVKSKPTPRKRKQHHATS
jgi:tetratricopeptide (TPR) repeat protein